MDRVASLRSAGTQVISLCAGEPDFDTPAHVCEAGIAAIRGGHTRYSQVAGIRPLREAVAAKFRSENGMAGVRWQDTLVTSGGKQAIFNALAATLNDGDEVVIPAPYWVSYPEIVQICGGESVIVPCAEDVGFKLTPDALRAALGAKSRWLILNSPSNPTGAVYSCDELNRLADVLVEFPDVLILCDDIYEHLIFDGEIFNTLAQVRPAFKDRILTMNGVSKAYAMTGWRIGFATGPGWLVEAMEKLQGQQTSGACTIAQYAALAALQGPKEFVRTSRAVFERRRNWVVEGLDAAPGLSCAMPKGAFYAFASCEGLMGRTTAAGTKLNTDEDVADALLGEAGVAVVPGSAFGSAPYFRISYALDNAALLKAIDAIGEFCLHCE
ncbi:Aspartate aminotransferase [Variovorax sp. SRS16]|uniref:pyridoxal phosphate-dependent aminotransferase n=1 Tax=Variovorax sp. SRS16 TaxID=282217 RepID=UPI0013164984|nr:pyridoxal phosphate-dependent aminotransferase [Variovorax sp. SRS16]VTU33155.1 Aspartate aminotransferase [Variovorax sp. SRS16]